MDYVRAHILVCGGPNCSRANSPAIIEEFHRQLEEKGLNKEVRVISTGCMDLCSVGPVVVIYPEGVYYSMIAPQDVAEIVSEHIAEGRVVERLLFKDDEERSGIHSLSGTDFYKHQQRIVLRNCGIIDPESIDEYMGTGGYSALTRVLSEMSPQEVIDEVKAAGLRGRGGAGFSTGMKWQFAADAPGDIKYVCCNADEGDPGAFMDRSILEGDPHAVVEAMTIAGYAIGSEQGFVYVRAEYPIAVKRLELAIFEAERHGFLGDNIFDSDFSFHLEVRLGSGAFVCGEETALMVSIEGKRGEPRPRPPFPAIKGLFGKPTLLNNVETYGNITYIINQGAKAYANIGTEGSKGTKVFALGGKIANTGLVEIPMGTTLRSIIEDIGGGVPDGKAFKAAQAGGPSGACIPAEYIDTEIDYDNLTAIGAMMGSGGLIVLNEDDCMVDIAKFFLQFTVEESCGKCPPCRIGVRRMLEILEKITSGSGTMEDIDNLEDLCYKIKATALCGLGQTAPNPVLSTLRFFRDEYEAHVKEGKCAAGSCKALLKYVINADKCKGCSACAKFCPTEAITGQLRSPFEINTVDCIKCGTCIEKCKFGAISVS